MRYFALNGTDHRGHDQHNAAIDAYLRRRHSRAAPKVEFSPASPVRTWTHDPAKAA